MPDEQDWAAKRQYVRVTVSFSLQYSIQEPLEARVEFGNKPGQANVEDMSQGGLCMICDYPVPQGAVLNLKFSLSQEAFSPNPHPFELEADVRYRDMRDRRYCLGLRFLRVSDDDKRMLGEYIRYVQSLSDF